ncbi:hypothetical protein RhiirA1_407063 [Rhizophagus irregularis]|uniref:Protein kinase domain-containing protein n=3 Tax=Rhizophagus irregularis TaxID=588596 RepID=U9T2L8_RHIID|nr:hypothetical protein GLOIN_2v1606510 [Rhizophagus irregularis DAOM 181602=DAOM 197198]EXX77782.1 hypothetical protein RirG_020620 [Rhizophagus irregularis DAOM 197198w]PKC75882.1 hypothetical protein RhiirA1_407063 [Rhizophagus irregularis]POG71292.1 hypothetical protein GLOIN_2v1606510 [Rhizophagus irregularis DAOM 181602=DAOM 197198]|eukprot:XP_025178158.1 hypothetical protein GLOIN_2v1606510 [Rhizophagus irregularis DAOM 181602=DAOM 197198]
MSIYALVMDYFPDRDLRKFIKQNLRWLQRLRFLNDIALSLRIMHELKIVHWRPPRWKYMNYMQLSPTLGCRDQ